MKRISILLISVLPFTEIKAQTIENLEKKKGFKNFVIGQPKSKYVNSITYHNTNSDGEKGYEYIPKSNQEIKVFDIQFDRILLYFNISNTLESIIIIKYYPFQTYEYSHFDTALKELKSINNNLEQLFGKPTGLISEDNENNTLLGLKWISKSYSLLSITNNQGLKEGCTNHIIISKSSDSIESGF